ncbi:enoyl-CoA hydratase/isomerase family protein, partial [Sphingomonas ginsenosidimutans]|uniref:enoyl-CoA hydratase/isomerase family protein n=1 Tax=Sphingomonas ginsenosidimutans TaxID=862134 RepID=UPI001E188852
SEIMENRRKPAPPAATLDINCDCKEIGVSYFLPRLVGASLAAELMLTGDFIHAERALACGLVSRIVPDAELEAAAVPLVERMLDASPLGLRLTKECLRMSIDAPSLEAAIAMEDRNQMLTVGDNAFAEGLAAFLEKRRPDYSKVARA